MGHAPLPQKQLLTVRQIVYALSILACLAFIVSYSGRVVLNSKVQGKEEELVGVVAGETEFQTQIKSLLANVNNPESAAGFARDEMNWALPGDQTVVTMNEPEDNATAEAVAASDSNPEVESASEPQNWQQWWELLVTGRSDLQIENPTE